MDVAISICEHKNDEFEADISVGISKCNFTLRVCVDENNTLEDQLKKTDEILQVIDDGIEYLEEEYDDEDEFAKNEINLHLYLKENVQNILDIATHIELSFENDEDNIEFLKNNKSIQNKKIILNEVLNVKSYDRILEIMEIYKDYIDNIYANMQGNNYYTKILDCYNSISKIKDIANKILSLNLSPMENVMYTYDIVRNRVYKEEDEDELPFASRDLNSVLNGDKIVCAGYSHIFSALLYYMGFNETYVLLSNADNSIGGHARNAIYIKDEKYDIDGVYYFDTTWDSKRANEKNEFLNKYLYFAKTRKEMDDLTKTKFQLIDVECPYCSENMYEEVKNKFENKDIQTICKQYFKSLQYYNFLINNESIVNSLYIYLYDVFGDKLDVDEFLQKVLVIQEKINKPISAETYIKLLNNVRKVEYQEDPDFYPYTIEKMYETLIRSNWNFKENHFLRSVKLLSTIIGEEPVELNKKDNFINYCIKEGIFQDIKNSTNSNNTNGTNRSKK